MTTPPAAPRPAPRFPELDRYLLRQKALAISPTYDVFDAEGQPVLHVVRPIRYLRTLLAGAASLVTLGYFALLSLYAYDRAPFLLLLLIPMGMVASSTINLLVQPYRHVYVFADDSREHLLLAIVQERKLVIVTAPYTLVDGEGRILARIEKNHAYSILRRRWQTFTPDGELLFTAWEDSVAKSLARRLVGSLYGVLRTNFIFTRAGAKLGEFNRQFTILDRYVLDLSADPSRLIDRRVAVALGIMLDTGEGR